MKSRFSVVVALAGVLVLMVAVPASVVAQEWTPKRLSDGSPTSEGWNAPKRFGSDEPARHPRDVEQRGCKPHAFGAVR